MNLGISGNKTIDLTVVALNMLILMLVFGLFLYASVLFEKPTPSSQDAKEDLLNTQKKATLIEGIKIQKMIINLRSQSKRLRYLELTPYLIPSKETYRSLLKDNLPLIKNAIIEKVSEKQPEEINNVIGKLKLENEIKDKIKALMGEPLIKDIQFESFVVQ